MRLVFLWLLLLLTLIGSGLARAADLESEEQLKNRYRYRIDKTLRDVKELNPTPECVACGVFTAAGEDTASPQCRQTYKDLYHIKERISDEKPSDQVIDFRVAFGYMDYLQQVDDQYAAIAFITQLASPCTSGRNACGFKRDPDDAEVFRKTISVLGPDGKARTRTVQLRLRFSSATNDERRNRREEAELQARLTKANEEFFAESLQKADMLLYVGHSRGGGGPSFGPPVVNPDTRRTDYDWYRKNKPGLTAMLSALQNSRKQPRILGLLSCNSSRDFREPIRKVAPSTGLILMGDENEFEASTAQAIATIDSALAMRCEDDFKSSINTVKEIGGMEISPLVLDGVFGTSK